MFVLIVDDEVDKFKDIRSCFKTDVKIDWAKSVRDANNLIRTNKYDIIILDISTKEGFHESKLNGVELIENMQFENIIVPVVVVTQYINFETYKNVENDEYFDNSMYGTIEDCAYDYYSDINYLPNLHKYLSCNYSYYLGSVLYKRNNRNWLNNLKKILSKVEEFKIEDFIIGR